MTGGTMTDGTMPSGAMSVIQFAAPRTMLIGGGTVRQIGELLARFGLSRPLVVSDPFMVSSGLIAALLDPLAAVGIVADVFSATVPDPTDVVVQAGVAALSGGRYDCLIGFGGGSPIDTAKAIAIQAGAGAGAGPGAAQGAAQRETGHIRAFKAPAQADHAGLPVIAVPTTAGTGSECTRFTVITDTERSEKMLIAGLGALPLAAIVDFELTYGLPPRSTADTGIDSLTHALEAYVSRRANPFSDALAESAMALIGAHLRTAYAEPRNAAARAGMMLGATQAGLAFSNASVALVHGMSRPIGAHFHVPHGLSNAMLLPVVTRYSLAGAPARYAAAARLIGFAGADAPEAQAGGHLVDGLTAWNHDLGVPSPRGYGISEAEWFARVDLMAEQALASGSPANNPRVPDAAAIVGLYRQVWEASLRNT